MIKQTLYFLDAPTGAGKTYNIAQYAKNNPKTIIAVPSKLLCQEIHQLIGEDCAHIVNGDTINKNETVTKKCHELLTTHTNKPIITTHAAIINLSLKGDIFPLHSDCLPRLGFQNQYALEFKLYPKANVMRL